MDFITALDGVKNAIDGGLRRFFSEKRRQAEKIHPQAALLVDAIRDFTLRGGKRTRAFLCWLGYEAAKIKDQKSKIKNTEKKSKIAIPPLLMRAMMGIELFQSFALIHDDIMDEDAVRRGGLTVHEHFKRKAESGKRKVKNAKHFGESMAILAGDLALVWADELMQEASRRGTSSTSSNNTTTFKLYQKMKEEVSFGQTLDVLADAGLPSADRATINRYKTAWYSVIRPLQIGAAIGGADERTLESFVGYGLAVGEAYQLRDDVLDGVISEETFRTQAATCEKQAAQAVQAIRAPIGVVSLLADFARFARDRRA